MKKLIQIEFIKYSRSVFFYAFIGMFIAIVVIAELITIHITTNNHLLKFNFPDAWGNLVYVASYMNFFLGIVLLFSVTTEYQYRTFRQHIVDGLNKGELFAAKYIYAICLALFTVLIVSITVVIFGYIYSEPGNAHKVFEGASLLGKYFVQLLGYISMALFFGVLFRTTILALIVYLFYMPIESLIGLVNLNVLQYFPKTLFGSVIAKPGILTTAQNLAGMHIDGPSDSTILILACIYILVFAGASYLLLKIRNL